jgi:multidrug efflux pump
VAEKVRANPHVANVNLDWEEPSKVVRLASSTRTARARSGSARQHLSPSSSKARCRARTVSTYREDNELIQILLRGPRRERARLSNCSAACRCRPPTAERAAVADRTLEYGFEEGIIWHRNRLPTVTVRADIYGKDSRPRWWRRSPRRWTRSAPRCLRATC